MEDLLAELLVALAGELHHLHGVAVHGRVAEERLREVALDALVERRDEDGDLVRLGGDGRRQFAVGDIGHGREEVVVDGALHNTNGHFLVHAVVLPQAQAVAQLDPQAVVVVLQVAVVHAHHARPDLVRGEQHLAEHGCERHAVGEERFQHGPERGHREELGQEVDHACEVEECDVLVVLLLLVAVESAQGLPVPVLDVDVRHSVVIAILVHLAFLERAVDVHVEGVGARPPVVRVSVVWGSIAPDVEFPP